MGLERRGSVYYFRERIDGVQYKKSLGTGDKKVAERLASKMRVSIIEGTYFDKSVGSQHRVIELLKEHATRQRPSYKKTLEWIHSHFAEHPLGKMLVSKVKSKDVANYLASRQEEGASNAQLNHERKYLSIAFNLGINELDWVRINPVNKISERIVEKVDYRVMRYDEEELLKSVDAKPHNWYKNVAFFLAHTGLRRGEVINLEWTDVAKGYPRTIRIRETKGNKPRTVPLDNVASGILTELKSFRNLAYNNIFLSSTGLPLMEENLYRSHLKFFKSEEVSKLVKKGLLQDFTVKPRFRIHDLRHTFGTRSAASGMPLHILQKIMGHADIKTTMKYVHHTKEDFELAVTYLQKR